MDLFWFLSLVNGVFYVIAAYLSSDVFTLCLFLLIGQILLSALSILICSASLPDFSLLPLKDFRPIFKLTLPFAALTILLVLIQRLGLLLVSSHLGDSATGIFSSATRVVDGLKFAHYAILGALLPALSRGSPESWQSFRKAFLFLMMLSLLFAAALVIFSYPIVLILYGKEFLPAVAPLSLLGWTLLPYTISSFIAYSLIARGLEHDARQSHCNFSAHLLLFSIFGLSILSGLSGAIWAAFIGECLQAVVFILFYFAHRGFNPQFSCRWNEVINHERKRTCPHRKRIISLPPLYRRIA